MGTSRRRALAYLLLLALGMGVPSAQSVESQNELKLKAAFLFSFAKFAEWPPVAFEGDDAALVIGVLGEDPFGGMLGALEGKTVKNRKVAFVQCGDIAAARRCHLLFVSKSMKGKVSFVLGQLSGFPVLTVSDMDGFAEKGGGIHMFSDGGKIRFNINLESARDSSIKIDSRLLGLAKKVIGE